MAGGGGGGVVAGLCQDFSVGPVEKNKAAGEIFGPPIGVYKVQWNEPECSDFLP
jgi:hypothetical protein